MIIYIPSLANKGKEVQFGTMLSFNIYARAESHEGAAVMSYMHYRNVSIFLQTSLTSGNHILELY